MKRLDRSFAHYFVVAACLSFLYVTGLSNLKASPIKPFSEFNTLYRVYDSPLGPSLSLAGTLERLIAQSSDHGPLYFLLLNLWDDIVGRDLFTYRLLSVLFGLIAIAFVYRLSLLTRDSDTALYAVFITAFMAFFVHYTYEVRMYSLLALVSAVAAWSYWKIVSVTGPVRWWYWLSLTISASASVYVHYFGLIMVAAIGVYHLLFVKKDRRWFQVCLALFVAGILFSPWLPVVGKAIAQRPAKVAGDSRLLFFPAVQALAGIFTNGLSLIVLVVVATVVLKFRQLGKAQGYLLFLACLIFSLMILGNEISPLLIARRLRYTIVLAIPWACAISIGLSLMPYQRWARLAFVVAWIVAFVAYRHSEDLALYTNRLTQSYDQIPHYQEFLYESHDLPGHNELIMSFHPNAFDATDNQWNKTLSYYRTLLTRWDHIVHVSYDDGELLIQSRLSTYATLEAIAENSNGIWVIHNPQQTGLSAMPVYTDWLTQHFKPCKRYLEKTYSVIEYYANVAFPCELITDADPFAIDYEGGTKLANYKVKQTAEQLTVYLWWGQTIEKAYSLSLQIFDQNANKVRALDTIISGEPLDLYALDISSLSEGDYRVVLIVYDFLTQKSQPGFIVNEQQRFEREIELARISNGT